MMNENIANESLVEDVAVQHGRIVPNQSDHDKAYQHTLAMQFILVPTNSTGHIYTS